MSVTYAQSPLKMFAQYFIEDCIILQIIWNRKVSVAVAVWTVAILASVDAVWRIEMKMEGVASGGLTIPRTTTISSQKTFFVKFILKISTITKAVLTRLTWNVLRNSVFSYIVYNACMKTTILIFFGNSNACMHWRCGKVIRLQVNKVYIHIAKTPFIFDAISYLLHVVNNRADNRCYTYFVQRLYVMRYIVQLENCSSVMMSGLCIPSSHDYTTTAV